MSRIDRHQPAQTPVHLLDFLCVLCRDAEVSGLSWDEAWEDSSFLMASIRKAPEDDRVRVALDLVTLLSDLKITDDELCLLIQKHTPIPLGLLEEEVPVRTSLEELRDLLAYDLDMSGHLK